jgi:hypothetical protein
LLESETVTLCFKRINIAQVFIAQRIPLANPKLGFQSSAIAERKVKIVPEDEIEQIVIKVLDEQSLAPFQWTEFLRESVKFDKLLAAVNPPSTFRPSLYPGHFR